MVLEMAVLHVKPGQAERFQLAFAAAAPIIAASHGRLSHELHRCLEHPNRFLLLVCSERLEDHTEGFRGSPPFQRWKALLHYFYDPFPEVLHYELVSSRSD